MCFNVSVSELYELKHLWNGEGDVKSRELLRQNVRILTEWIYHGFVVVVIVVT